MCPALFALVPGFMELVWPHGPTGPGDDANFVLPTGWTFEFHDLALPVDPQLIRINVLKPTNDILIDGVAQLNELKTRAMTQVSKVPVNITGGFPTWSGLMPGMLIAGATAFDADGTEVCTAVSFDGDTQELHFQGANIVVGTPVERANDFLNSRAYRRAL
ncbi:hypothetical protein CCP3SC15_3400001 [Gammaproteobacteria bacterium]